MNDEEFYKKCKFLNQESLNVLLNKACSLGNLDRIEYLLTSDELKTHANIHTEKDFPIYKACYNGDINLVKYLLTSPKLNEHSNIHADNDEAFKTACAYKKTDLIKYLIFEYKIEKTPAIKSYLEIMMDMTPQHGEIIENMFKIRDLNDSLAKQLDSDKIIKSASKKIKV